MSDQHSQNAQAQQEPSQTDIRLALLAAGYVPLPAIGKQCKMTNWPRVPVTEPFIRHIGRSTIYTGSGIRIARNLIVIDVDTDIDDLAEALWAEIMRQAADFLKNCVVRHSGAASFALFGRANSRMIGRLTTARFKAAGKGRNHAVEVFGPAAVKFVAVSGPHTVKDGVVTRSYGFDGPALWEVPYADLPVLPDAVVLPLLNSLEAIIGRHPGMERNQPERHADRKHAKVYDLDEDQVVRLEDGTQESLFSLGQRLVGGGYETAYANIWDPASSTPDRCRVGVSDKGVYVIDWKMETTHHLASRKPRERLAMPLPVIVSRKL